MGFTDRHPYTSHVSMDNGGLPPRGGYSATGAMINGNGRGDQSPSPASRPYGDPGAASFRSGLNSGGDQEQNGEQNDIPLSSPDDIVDVLRVILPQMDPDSRQALVGKLSELLASLEHMNGGEAYGNNGNGNGDRRPRSGNRGASDRRLAQDADAAKRAMHERDFARRFPHAAKINIGGNPR